ncbi:MAG TPA: MFS transporter, partial [Xanthobacteraceae bacterium]
MLGLTEILSWGALFYPPVLTVPLIAADHGWSPPFAMAGFSVGLFVGGLCSRYVGSAIDRVGGHVVMPVGSLIGAAGLVALAWAPGVASYFAAWITIGIAMAASLYDPAFATLGRIFGSAARTPITALTLVAGFASTVSWPVTQFLIQTVGWRGAYLVYAALLAGLAAPLHAFALPREQAGSTSRLAAPADQARKVFVPSHGFAFLLVAAGFASYAFVPSALSAQLLAIFQRFGLAPTTVVAIGMLFGPAQVLARICEFSFARRLHPLWIARGAVGLLVAAFVALALLPFSASVAAIFAVMFGMANGLLTIARGTVPLALFGASGYGRLMG